METPLINILISTVKNDRNQIYDEKWRTKLTASSKAEGRPKFEK